MGKALLARAGQALLSLFVLLVCSWSLLRLTGDPVNFLLPPSASDEQRAFVSEELGLDKPLPVQFAIYLRGVAQGDLGVSYSQLSLGTPVSELIGDRMPATLLLAVSAIVLTILIAVPLGVLAAYWRSGWLDRFARLLAASGQAIPNFWFGLLLILVFAVNLKVLPAGGYGTFEHLILPSCVLAFGAVAGVIRLLRSSMLEVLGNDYIMFHRIKGLPERTVLWKHGLRNAGLTTLSYVGLFAASLFTGSVLVEVVFVWPGLGLLFVDAISYRDFNLIQGLILAYGVTYIVVNLIIDLLYTVLDPRLR